VDKLKEMIGGLRGAIVEALGPDEADLAPTEEELERFLYALVVQAQLNFQSWGMQGLETLALALSEEQGEVARAVLDRRAAALSSEPGAPLGAIREETVHAGALCLQLLTEVRIERERLAREGVSGKPNS